MWPARWALHPSQPFIPARLAFAVGLQERTLSHVPAAPAAAPPGAGVVMLPHQAQRDGALRLSHRHLRARG